MKAKSNPPPPHPIPYQGSKRQLADRILSLVPGRIATLYEPFAGSAAVTLAAASRGLAGRYVLGDSLVPLVGIWRAILAEPEALAERYRSLWETQLGRERVHYDEVRARFNRDQDPAALLYLLARCVKNAVCFNRRGEFNQSPDNRRLGMHPHKMRREILAASALLQGKTEVESSDYEDLLSRAGPSDLVYMDPPYQGTSQGRDVRYHQGLDLDRFLRVLRHLRKREVPFLISFDGRTGARSYGQELPGSLGLTRIELVAGRSTQATLLGRHEITVESIYLSPGLAGVVRQGNL
ncbi:MAG: DNA adenine methylase [Myxococcales bacterium]|nr:DNA adenine methylase [Polyangiaceae bacterium]MDW8251194.1 DNA adenine methylase [Myxococcales bacterium]